MSESSFVARPERLRGVGRIAMFLGGLSVWGALHAPAGPARVLAFAALAGIVLALGRRIRKVRSKGALVARAEGLEWPGCDLFVPWADVVSLGLVDPAHLGVSMPALRVEVRDGDSLLARQAPDAWIPRGV